MAMTCAVLVTSAIVFSQKIVSGGTFPALVSSGPQSQGQGGPTDWEHFGNDVNGDRYSPLTQINTANVGDLKLAWTFRTHDIAPGYFFESTPLEVKGVLYACSPSGQVFALNAATGALKWHFNAKGDVKNLPNSVCRGVTYAVVYSVSDVCSARIYVATMDGKLWSLDAQTGRPCEDFGVRGAVDLLAQIGPFPRGDYTVTSAPTVAGDNLLVGARVEDNINLDMPSGVVRAYNLKSGQLAWAWDVGRPDMTGAPPKGETYTRSTPNVWAPMAYDAKLGLVYMPTGIAAVDLWGQRRRPFDEKFGSSLVAVDANTGKTRWSVQIVHHDVWDYDINSQPVLVDLPTATGIQPAVVVSTKLGYIYILNRETGKPILPIMEEAVPTQSNDGEKLSPTQPRSPLEVNPGPDHIREADMWGLTPVDQLYCRIEYRKARYEGRFTPPGAGSTIVFPGPFGGIEWGGVSIDPVRKILIANATAMPFIIDMVRAPLSDTTGTGLYKGMRNMIGTGWAETYGPFMSPIAVPCLAPPWGKLYAIDLNTMKVVWSRLVGTGRDSGPFGMRFGPPVIIGTPQAGGSVITRGGLIFAGATLDDYLHAYDVRSGAELWRGRLPAGGQATPMTYGIAGKQYVVISAGGHGALGTKPGDSIVAYALKTTG
jgi:membrane-bound PQQ-dependent dehydrogenase (glucose/quinate/shikimate family)